MNENEIKQALDRLAEYHSQKDSIAAAKRAMLDEVKVPAEILALQDEANKESQKVVSFQRGLVENLRRECEAKLSEITIPEEVKAILAKIDNERGLVMAYQRAKEAEYAEKAQKRSAEIHAETQAKTAQVYADLAEKKREIEAEFAGREQAAAENIAKLEKEIKEATRACGKTVKGAHFSAVYVKGRVTWNTDMLDGMVALVPQLASARKEGEPSITLRKI